MPLTDLCKGISLGLFAGDLGNLRAQAGLAQEWGGRIAHFDVMDGVFVPQLTGGAGFVRAAGNELLRDVHLMIQRPALHVADYVAAGADIITVHVESENCIDAIYRIRAAADAAARDVLVGVSLFPGTPLSAAAEAFALAPDLILVLALDPREQVGADIAAACARVAQVRRILPSAVIGFDGGVTEATLAQVATTGVEMVVSGSAILRAPDPRAAFERMSLIMQPQPAI